MKKLKFLIASFALVFSMLSFNIMSVSANEGSSCILDEPTTAVDTNSEKYETRSNPSDPVTMSVNTTITDTMSQGGCWASVSFKIVGSYTYANISGIYTLMNNNLSVSISSKPSDWTVAIDSVQYEMDGASLIVKIRYHYRASYYDCASSGGYQYTMKTARV